ncbi:hypothetical protein EDC19_2439 [Natranaerovirga hydrolytica]|uniref:Uncharacterized protein n=1 Tax=Natranaerovirga hydrolytica TaxID=680378 RepID=A0A4R1M9J1_9FIRM|nr:hypothetical protein EDC19_2439 [Natranaerovirga hydrolytica]
MNIIARFKKQIAIAIALIMVTTTVLSVVAYIGF